ncbi:MAG: creatininase family protein [Anaerolineae bacterium]|nr:creatininase family protein [Anaerolineae bacterium]
MKVLYAELTPQEFRERLAEAPIAYLPLGTLEWHGEHLPLGADGLQSQGFFEQLAREVGGIVLPMLFLGIDRMEVINGQEFYGMDICSMDKYNGRKEQRYETQQLVGSAYWIPDATFEGILVAVLKQLARAGFRIIVGHGHGPSTSFFRDHAETWREKFDLECLVCWGSSYDQQGLGIQVDHAAMNETSLVMALRPDLVQLERLPADLDQWPLAIAGKDPREFASAKLGHKAIDLQIERMADLLRSRLATLEKETSVLNNPKT